MVADAGPSPSPSPGFLKRHRQTLLVVAFVLYTIVLAVGVADDVLHLGIFPTELERRARRLVRQLDGPEEERQAAAERLVQDIDSYVAVPELLRALDSDSPGRRALAADCLRRMTKTEHGYDPDAPPAERRAAVARWRAWWAENKYRY